MLAVAARPCDVHPMRAFLTFLAAYVLSQFYRSFLAVIAPELARELALDPQALGNLQAFWIAGFVAMQLPVGWALDTIGPRRTIASLMLAAVAGAILFATAGSAVHLNIAMALIGIGCSAIYMGAIYVFGRVNRPEQFALLCSWLLGIGAAGNLLAASPLAWAATMIGWRGAMWGMAALTALSAASVLALIRDPERIGASGFFSGITDILKLQRLWPLLPLALVSYSVVLSVRGLWAGPYFTDVHGLGPVERGHALLVMAAAMSVGALVYGPLDRILGTRKWIVVGGSAVTAAGFLALGFLNPSLTTAIILMGLLGAFGMTYGVLMAHGRSFVPDHLLGRGITLLNILLIGGTGLLQPLSGAVMKAGGSYDMLFVTYGTVLLLATGVYLASTEQR